MYPRGCNHDILFISKREMLVCSGYHLVTEQSCLHNLCNLFEEGMSAFCGLQILYQLVSKEVCWSWEE